MNEPFLSDFVSNFRVTPSVCSIVIFASATGFPCASTTVPVIMPCAAAGSAKPKTTMLARTRCHANWLENRRIIANPPEESPVFEYDSLHEIRSEEGRERVEFVDHRRRRQRGEEPAPIAFCPQARVEDGE